MLAVLLLLIAAAQPVAGACCAPPSRAATLMPSMPCCAGTCPTIKAAPHQDATSAILTTASPAPALAPVASVVVAAPVAIASVELPATHQESPPSFLLHEQFRI